MDHHTWDDADEKSKYKDWSDQILITAVFAILLTAPIGVICIEVLGPLWLEKNDSKVESNPHHDR